MQDNEQKKSEQQNKDKEIVAIYRMNMNNDWHVVEPHKYLLKNRYGEHAHS